MIYRWGAGASAILRPGLNVSRHGEAIVFWRWPVTGRLYTRLRWNTTNEMGQRLQNKIVIDLGLVDSLGGSHSVLQWACPLPSPRGTTPTPPRWYFSLFGRRII